MLKLKATTPSGVRLGRTASNHDSSDECSGSGWGAGWHARHSPPGATLSLRLPHFAQSPPFAHGMHVPPLAAAVSSRMGSSQSLQATLAMAQRSCGLTVELSGACAGV